MYSNVTRIYSNVARLYLNVLACTRMLLVCTQTLLFCTFTYLKVSRMYSYVLVCCLLTRALKVTFHIKISDRYKNLEIGKTWPTNPSFRLELFTEILYDLFLNVVRTVQG